MSRSIWDSLVGKKILLLSLFVTSCSFSDPTQNSSDGSLNVDLGQTPDVTMTPPAPIGPGLGWQELPATQLRSVAACPDDNCSYTGNTGFRALTEAWNSAAYDTNRNRLVVLGGGHADYFGNEMYAIDMVSQSALRITDPATPPASSCVAAIAGGTQPNSRHTYDAVTYISHLDQLFIYGGSLACGPGNFGNDAWIYHFQTMRWERIANTQVRADASQIAIYNSVDRLVYLWDREYIYTYNPETKNFTRLNQTYNYAAGTGWHKVGAIDTKRNHLLIIGDGGAYRADLSLGASVTLATINTVGPRTAESLNYPGLAYDPNLDRYVAWGGGSTIYMLNPDSLQWETLTVSGAPVALANGTYKRFSYIPDLRAYIAVNSVDRNAFILKLY